MSGGSASSNEPTGRAGQTALAGPRTQDIYEELFELAPDAYLFTTPGGRILHANRAACALLNGPRRTLVGSPISGFLPRADYHRLLRDLPPAPLDALPLPEREVALRPLRRTVIPVAITLGVARDRSGRRYGLRWLLRDVSERKRVEEQLQASVQEKELLLREVYHRVKNNLQVICSLLSLQEVAVQDEATLQVLRSARDRMRSMALVHERLYRSSDLSQVVFGDYLRELARELRHSYGVPSQDVRFVFDLVNASIGIDVAIPCSMIVHELVSNALRHAFPDGRHGSITIELCPEGPGLTRLTVTDDGVGLPASGEDRPRAGSLGLQLVVMMVEQIEGRMEVGPGPGARFTIVFPLTVPGPAPL